MSCKKTFKDIEDPGWNTGKVNSELTVMSYNVHYCSPKGTVPQPNVDAIAAVISELKADVVFLQEIDKNTLRSGKVDQLAQLSKKTNMPYTYFGKTIDYQGGQTGSGILSRYNLINPQTFPLPRVNPEDGSYVTDRVLITSTIVINERKVTIANTHLELTQENRDLQVIEIERILSTSNYPIIFGGDFNSTSESKTMKSLFDLGFKKTCLKGCNTIPSDAPNREIDFILLRPEAKFEVKSHTVLRTEASDHLPITAVIKVL